MDYKVSEAAGLLAFLLARGMARGKAKSLLKYGQIFVNGKAVRAFDHALHPGDAVSVGSSTKRVASAAAQLDIVFEDSELIVINKPHGLLSVPAGDEEADTAYHLVDAYLRAENSKNRAHIVHRLDRDTSGLLLFSKSKELKELLQADWNDLVSARDYYAVVEGILEEKEGEITSWLSPKAGYQVRSSSFEREESKKAVTQYRVLREGGSCSLLEISLKTGRKNQIRVHMRDLKHPVVGDKKYYAKTNPLSRLALHACRLSFRHPHTGEMLTFESKAPRAFSRLLNQGNGNPPPQGGQ